MSVHFFGKEVSVTAAMVACAFWSRLGVAIPAVAQVQTVVEYGYVGFPPEDCVYYVNTRQWVCFYRSYFVTSVPDEIAALDGAAIDGLGGWHRTGETFNVWSGPESDALPTCRFFNLTCNDPLHFYTPYASECAALQAKPAWHWEYEGIAFYLQVPDESGNCPIGTTVLYRLYRAAGGAPAHRLTTSVATFNQMLDDGWVFEGDGRTFAFACRRPPRPRRPRCPCTAIFVL